MSSWKGVMGPAGRVCDFIVFCVSSSSAPFFFVLREDVSLFRFLSNLP